MVMLRVSVCLDKCLGVLIVLRAYLGVLKKNIGVQNIHNGCIGSESRTDLRIKEIFGVNFACISITLRTLCT